MTTMRQTDLQTYPPLPDFIGPVLLADLASHIEVPHVALSPAGEEEMRVRACLQRLAALRRRIELIGG